MIGFRAGSGLDKEGDAGDRGEAREGEARGETETALRVKVDLVKVDMRA